MEIEIIENINEDPKVIIKCRSQSAEVLRLRRHIELFDAKIAAKGESETFYVNLTEVLYFESVDNRTFLYTEKEVMEISERLYELEELLSEKDFIRSSKSQILNIKKITALKPQLNRTILATMSNGEKLYISRKYVPVIKKLLSL